VFTPEDRDRIRSDLLAAARADGRISGAAITGSASLDREDRWSDIDLAFGITDATAIAAAMSDWTALMYERHNAVHHVDEIAGAWIYRVFLLRNTLQVDLAFVAAAEFAPRAPSFRLVFGATADRPYPEPRRAENLIAFAWLYGLHVRSSIERGKLWQAEYMVTTMRNYTLALACLRRGLPAAEGRGFDQLPREVTAPLDASFVSRLDVGQLRDAFAAVMRVLRAEIAATDGALARRVDETLEELARPPIAAS
jgi:hypothetical protein